MAFWRSLREAALARGVPMLVLAYLRVLLGKMWLGAGVHKLEGSEAWDMLGTVEASLARTPGWYRPFVDHVVLPHRELFNFLVTYGELAVGLSLILGLTGRLGALGGMFLSANYAILQGRNPLFFSGWDSVYFWMAVVLFAGNAGRFLGIDQWLYGKWPKARVW